MKEQKNINVKEAQEILEVFGSLDEKTKSLALATLTGMRLVVEVDKSIEEDKGTA